MTRIVQISGQTFRLDSEAVSRQLVNILPEPIQKHYVVIEGRRYPPKQVISLVTGLDRADFTTHQARRVLRGLGFPAARREAARDTSQQPGEEREAPMVARLRPHIGDWVAVKGEEVLVADSDPGRVIAWLSQHGMEADSLFRVPEDEASAGGSAPA
jgi:predicted double-glycine peptidase